MSDIEMRFHKDILVLSAPPDETMRRYQADPELDRELFNLIEPETLNDIMRFEQMAGAQCLVTCTEGITRARLAHQRFEEQSGEIAQAALAIAAGLSPQHIIADIGSTRLPIDPASKSSLRQSRDQYAQAARDFGEEGFDAFLLDDLGSIADLKCGLMGVRMVTDKPLMVTVPVDADGNLVGRGEPFSEALTVMTDLGADVVGFTTASPLARVLSLVKQTAEETDLPILVQLVVGEHDEHDIKPGFRPVIATENNPYRTTDAVFEAAPQLIKAGVQFLRAVGKATAAYTGSLAVGATGLDAVR
ncbi:MAG: homocysteine S-methyltransferase family protein [Eggerthellaceae bacterium]|jgi:5-methyltetrahydrofolate--homocysteine methyltransferase